MVPDLWKPPWVRAHKTDREFRTTCSCFPFYESSLCNKALGILPCNSAPRVCPWLHRTEKDLCMCLGFSSTNSEPQE